MAKDIKVENKVVKPSDKKIVECRECTQTVEVKLIPFGSGHIAECPVCDKLALATQSKN